MSEYVATLDGGTTNTRAFLWRGRQCLCSAARPVGVKDTAVGGSNAALVAAVGECLRELLAAQGLGWAELRCVVAAGMLTSDLGIYELPHLAAPAGVEDFAAGMRCAALPEVCPSPIWFVPGLRNLAGPVDLENAARMDIMRGEEAEAVALLPLLPGGLNCVLVLPGSHTKFIAVSREGIMTGCATSMTGELLSLLTKSSILAGDVKGVFAQEAALSEEYLLAGYRAARDQGLGKAAFGTRLLRLFAGAPTEALTSYLLGAVLESDVKALGGAQALAVSPDTAVVIAGKEPFSSAFQRILVAEGGFRQVSRIPQAGDSLSGLGCLRLAEERGLISKGRG